MATRYLSVRLAPQISLRTEEPNDITARQDKQDRIFFHRRIRDKVEAVLREAFPDCSVSFGLSESDSNISWEGGP